jgi:hypothetical protein
LSDTRLCSRLKMFWLSLCFAVAAAVVFVGAPGWLAGPVLLATLLLAVRAFVSGRSVRRGLLLLPALLALLVGLGMASLGMPHVSVAARSPDGRVIADVYETDRFLDRHFQVRLTTFWLGIIPIRQVVFRSPDEGPRGGERLIWSRDGRYVLLLGRHLFATDDACLASGEALYLLVDTRTKAIASNAQQTRHRRFSLQELASRDFDITLVPGVRDRQSMRCIPG